MVQLIFQKFNNFFEGKELILKLNKFEEVSYGATIMTATKNNLTKKKLYNFSLLNVSALPLGIEKDKGIMDIIIPRNLTYQTKKSKNFFSSKHSSFFSLPSFDFKSKIMTIYKDNHSSFFSLPSFCFNSKIIPIYKENKLSFPIKIFEGENQLSKNNLSIGEFN